jgi:hypothetical protein
MDYGGILSRTWEVTWKYKGLWVLGFLASCGAAGQSNGGSGGSGLQYSMSAPQAFRSSSEAIDPAVLVAIAVVLILVFLCLGLLVLALSVIAQGGLIAGFSRADDGADVSLREAFRFGAAHFWKLLGIRIVFWLVGIVLVLFVIVGLVVFILGTFGIGLLLIPLCCCLVIPFALLGILVEAYMVLTMVAAIEEELGVLDAFRRSWDVFRANFVPVAIMGLILVLGSGILTLIFILPMFFVVVPIAIGLLAGGDESILFSLIAGGFCFLALIPVIIVVNSIITTFVTGGWTITYRRLIGRRGAEVLGSA